MAQNASKLSNDRFWRIIISTLGLIISGTNCDRDNPFLYVERGGQWDRVEALIHSKLIGSKISSPQNFPKVPPGNTFLAYRTSIYLNYTSNGVHSRIILLERINVKNNSYGTRGVLSFNGPSMESHSHRSVTISFLC